WERMVTEWWKPNRKASRLRVTAAGMLWPAGGSSWSVADGVPFRRVRSSSTSSDNGLLILLIRDEVRERSRVFRGLRANNLRTQERMLMGNLLPQRVGPLYNGRTTIRASRPCARAL